MKPLSMAKNITHSKIIKAGSPGLPIEPLIPWLREKTLLV